MQEIMSSFGDCEIAEDGKKALELFTEAFNLNKPYEVIFLDIMMPEMDGQVVLNRIREIEAENGIVGLDAVKIIMTTALDDYDNIKSAFKNQAEGYLVKPIDKDKVVKTLLNLHLLD